MPRDDNHPRERRAARRPPDDTKANRSLHGLTRSLLNNMVVGVTHGFEKKLEINGVGYPRREEGRGSRHEARLSHDVTIKGDG